MPTLTANSEYEDKRFYDKMVRSTLESCDLSRDLRALERSAGGEGSGQALRAYQYSAGEASIELSPLLNRHFARRAERTLWINVLSGCDFITPHSHKNRPKCKLCGKNSIDIFHLLLDCPEIDQNMLWVNKIRRELTNSMKFCRKIENRSVAEQTRRVLDDLLENGDKTEIFKFIFGLACKESDDLSPLRHGPILWRVIKCTASQLSTVQKRWFDADAD